MTGGSANYIQQPHSAASQLLPPKDSSSILQRELRPWAHSRRCVERGSTLVDSRSWGGRCLDLTIYTPGTRFQWRWWLMKETVNSFPPFICMIYLSFLYVNVFF